VCTRCGAVYKKKFGVVIALAALSAAFFSLFLVPILILSPPRNIIEIGLLALVAGSTGILILEVKNAPMLWWRTH
jgi:hypothetical protein